MNAGVKRRGEQPQAAERHDRELRVNVVFTDLAETLLALRAAARLAADLRAHIVVVVPQVVPYPAPIEAPPISTAFLVHRFRTVADDMAIDLHVRVYICRDRRTVLAVALGPQSLVVIAGRRSWWPTREQRLAAELAHLGHDVVFCTHEWGS
ncbi:MAG TPA: hypothetical protein VLE22_11475 [Bryobacteraceae bacterium]|nr:hypothetical protein [Bryobacteraceae bacterium]